MKRIPLWDVSADGGLYPSTSVVSAGYDHKTHVLEVEFRSIRADGSEKRTLYQYRHCRKIYWTNLCKAKSKGRYMRTLQTKLLDYDQLPWRPMEAA